MARGEKTKYTDKQKRQAEKIEKSYRKGGMPAEKAEARAWATVNKTSGGGKKPGGSGRAKKTDPDQASGKKGVDFPGKRAGKTVVAALQSLQRGLSAVLPTTGRKRV